MSLPTLTRGLCHARATLLHRLLAECAFINVILFRTSQEDSPSCAHCNSTETLDHLLLQCPAYSVSRQCHFFTLGPIGAFRPDVRSVLFPSTFIAHGIIIRNEVFTFLDASTLFRPLLTLCLCDFEGLVLFTRHDFLFLSFLLVLLFPFPSLFPFVSFFFTFP